MTAQLFMLIAGQVKSHLVPPRVNRPDRQRQQRRHLALMFRIPPSLAPILPTKQKNLIAVLSFSKPGSSPQLRPEVGGYASAEAGS